MTAPTMIDLFAGAGGASEGLKRAGFAVLAAIEKDELAAQTYESNHSGVRLYVEDIRRLSSTRLRNNLGLAPGELSLLEACPPCQGFSTLARGQVDEAQNDLVLDVVRFVRAFMPRALLLENVPGLRLDSRLRIVEAHLDLLGYRSRQYLIDASDFGVPQRRRRLILIAVGPGERAALPESLIDALPSTFSRRRRTAGSALRSAARWVRADDPLNVHQRHSPEIAARLRAIPVGGDRFSLPAEHQLACHKRLGAGEQSSRHATSSYGRILADEPAPTLTTRCTTPACGRFVHPTEPRGLTLREAATLQTFSARYRFRGHYTSVERQIGNAIPVRLAEALGNVINSLLSCGTPAR